MNPKSSLNETEMEGSFTTLGLAGDLITVGMFQQSWSWLIIT